MNSRGTRQQAQIDSAGSRVKAWVSTIPFGTRLVACLLVGVFVFGLVAGRDVAWVCTLPAAVIYSFQFWRLLTPPIFHANILHITLNIAALLPMGRELERDLGTMRFLWLNILFGILSGAINVLMAWFVFITVGLVGPLRECGIGYSGVLFGLIVVQSQRAEAQTISVFGWFRVPRVLYPFALLAVTQLLMQGSSFIGHLCGILIGYGYSYRLLRWLDPASFLARLEQAPLLSGLPGRYPSWIASAQAAGSRPILPLFGGESSRPPTGAHPSGSDSFGGGHVLGRGAAPAAPPPGSSSISGGTGARSGSADPMLSGGHVLGSAPRQQSPQPPPLAPAVVLLPSRNAPDDEELQPLLAATAEDDALTPAQFEAPPPAPQDQPSQKQFRSAPAQTAEPMSIPQYAAPVFYTDPSVPTDSPLAMFSASFYPTLIPGVNLTQGLPWAPQQPRPAASEAIPPADPPQGPAPISASPPPMENIPSVASECPAPPAADQAPQVVTAAAMVLSTMAPPQALAAPDARPPTP
ncbi:putative rhomboid family protein [Paratrimastix pyriformis]|uniref:Rhomboid family protein n=1 Tax=Paratrimastix pyriformis TaxID=342808 RepID=A0ABQ8UV05_9EUKA|nr:putative rhomboid family protein [Paratrimastix pyriformis]